MYILIGSNMIIGLNKIINMIDDFSNQRDWSQFHSPKNLAVSISIEANELLECFQWDNPPADELIKDPQRLQKVKSELADVLNYTLRMCSILDLDPIEIVCQKLQENAKKYPVHLSKGKSTKYTELEGHE
jgi:dCTP diphosphatase